MKLSYSRVDTFKQCPYKYKLRYVDRTQTIFNCDPGNALALGTALHAGIEKDTDTAIEGYFNQYPIINDLHIHEATKLRNLIPKAVEMLPDHGEHEVKIETEDFIGYIDLLVETESNHYDIYDFKYSNSIDRYRESTQLHLYKYYFERTHPGAQIDKLYYVIVPKTQIRQRKNETLFEFRNRLDQTLKELSPQLIEVPYDPNKVIDFLHDTKHMLECQEYEKCPAKLCDWCEYQSYCESEGELLIDIVPMKGELTKMLPKNERQQIAKTNYMKGWIYAPPFSGKTTFLDAAPDPLNLNTDGNTKYVTMQRLLISDHVEEVGRRTERTFAWEILKNAIADLEKGADFQTIILDLVEDTYEMCRLYMYDKLGITHESDDSFRAWDKVRTEYLSTIRRLLVLPYNIFLLSHEDTSKDLMSRNGDRITSIKPNLNDKVANKLAGMVDFVARIEINDSEERFLSFKTNDVIFGGGRLNMGVDKIPLQWEELVKIYESASDPEEQPKQEERHGRKRKTKEEAVDEPVESDVSEDRESDNSGEEPKPRHRSRKNREPEQDEPDDTEEPEPPRRTGRRRTNDTGNSEEPDESTDDIPAEEDSDAEVDREAEEVPKRRTRRRRTREVEE